MIDQVLNAIVTQLNTYIGTADPEVILGNVSFADAFQETSSHNLSDKVIASVINIEQEDTLRNLPFRRTAYSGGIPQGVERQPDIFLNIYVLFGANKHNYSTALNRISQVLSFFQRQYVFTATDIPVLSVHHLDRVIFDLYSTSFEQLNQLWSIMGGKYMPSVVYKMRLAVIQDTEPRGTGIITEIDLGAKVLSNQAPEI